MNRTSTDRRLTNEHLRRLGLKEHPFRSSADPRFLYLSSQHQAILDRLQDVIEWQEGLSVVEGPIGTGKTSVARRLYELARQEDSYLPVYIHTATFSTPLEAARDIASHFGLEARRAYTDQLRDFEEFLVKMRQENKNPVVIIDDAQLMAPKSLETIQNILNFDLREKLIQLILFGQQEIHASFVQLEALLDRVVYWQKLGPLPYADVVGLINFRHNVAGRSEPMFTDSALSRLFEFSGGIPRPLIIVCNEVLRILVEKGKNMADVQEVDRAVEIYEQRPRKESDGS